ncbi:hypothetical protein J0H58_34530 [bacterium]|nr:hypothetical protein [bacterium]
MSTSTPSPTPYRRLSEFQGRLPGHRRNARLHLSTLIRWCSKGVKLPDGTRLRLRADRLGARWLTTDAWWQEFVDRLTATHAPDAPIPLRSAAERSRASVAAGERLRSLGM